MRTRLVDPIVRSSASAVRRWLDGRLAPALMIALLSTLASPLVSSAHAQAITAEVLTIYRQGQTTPATAPIVLPRANIQCAQTTIAPPGGTVANPLRAAWPDPADATRDCVYRDPGNGPLAMLAFDAAVVYEATLVFRNGAGDSAASPRSNLFTRPGVPPASPARLVIAP